MKAIGSVERSALMIAPEKVHGARIADPHGQQQAHDFYGLISTIDVVSQEEVFGGWRMSQEFQKAQQVEVLAVNVT